MDLKPISSSAKALSKPLVKLLDVVQSGVGALGGPLVTILNAHGEGRAKLIREGYEHRLRLLQTRNAQELNAAIGVTALLPPSQNDLDIEVVFDAAEHSESVASRIMGSHQREKRRANVMTITAEAADAIGDEVSDESVDPDWVARFFTYAQDVSSDQLQQLWGRILAGEVEQPGRVPLRSLEILRNLSQKEANMVRKLTSRVSKNSCYLHYGSQALTSAELRALRDAQILEDSISALNWKADPAKGAGPVRPFEEPGGSAELPYPSGHLLKLRTTSAMFVVNVWVVRPSALPVLNVARPSTDIEYLSAVVQAINKEDFFRAELASPPSDWG